MQHRLDTGECQIPTWEFETVPACPSDIPYGFLNWEDYSRFLNLMFEFNAGSPTKLRRAEKKDPDGEVFDFTSEPRYYLSYGGGVGSTALLVHLLQTNIADDLEVVYVDHSGDLPETAEYIAYIQKEVGIKITILHPEKPLYEMLYDTQTIPLFTRRACTRMAKLEPFYEYATWGAVYLGITWDERHRAGENERAGYVNMYPFVQKGITRDDAIKIIRRADLDIPEKSGCFFCPHQGETAWIKLRTNHPDLWYKAIDLERNSQLKHPGSSLLRVGTLAQWEQKIQAREQSTTTLEAFT